MTECKQGKELNEIHHMTSDKLESESDNLRAELRGHLTSEQRTHKTSRLQLVDSYLRIRTGKMDTQAFRAAQDRLGLTNAKMAALICCSMTHLENLRRGYKLEGGKRVDVLPTVKDTRIVDQAEELQRLKAT
jgi:hypothetical protein